MFAAEELGRVDVGDAVGAADGGVVGRGGTGGQAGTQRVVQRQAPAHARQAEGRSQACITERG